MDPLMDAQANDAPVCTDVRDVMPDPSLKEHKANGIYEEKDVKYFHCYLA